MALPGSTELGYRIGSTALKRIFDDDRDGTADVDPVTQLLADAKSKVFGVLRATGYTLADVEANPPHEVNRLMLDAAVAYAAQRHPEVVRRDWVPLMAQVDADLMKIRKGVIRLDVAGTPEPPTNEGGSFTVGDPADFDASTYKRTFGDGFGDF